MRHKPSNRRRRRSRSEQGWVYEGPGLIDVASIGALVAIVAGLLIGLGVWSW